MIEQLWYGWAARGAEGLNMQQIIAASPGLTDRGALLTKTALAQCTTTTEPTAGWCAHNDVHVVFRRSPAGLDGRGRPGNYFVHVLVGHRTELPAQALAALVTSDLLLSGLPDEVPDTLPHVVLPRLPAVDVDDPAVRRVLAGYLANLRAGQLTALTATPDQAAVLAGSIAATMPPQLGLPGFSVTEKPDRAAHYDMVSGFPPSTLFGAADPADPPHTVDTDSASLLLSARREHTAAECVDLLAADQPSRRSFALALADWCAIERAEPGSITPDTRRLLLDRPGIRRRFISLPALPHLVAPALLGERLAGALAEAFHLDGEARVLDVVCDHVRGTRGGVSALHALTRAGARTLATAALSTLVQGGERLDLSSLSENQQLELLDLFPLDPDPSPVVAGLLLDSDLGIAVVGHTRFPLTWQVLAARRHAARIRPEQFDALLRSNPNCAQALVAEQPGAQMIERLGETLRRLESSAARQVLRACSGRVPAGADQTWWDTVSSRIDPSDEFDFVVERAQLLGDIGDGWAVGAFARTAQHALRSRRTPPSFVRLQRILGTMRETEWTWRDVVDAYIALDENGFVSSAVRRTLEEIRHLQDRDHRWVIRDLLLGRVLTIGDPRTFQRAMAEVERCHGLRTAANMVLRGAAGLSVLTAPAVSRLLDWGVHSITRADHPKLVAAALDSDQMRDMVARTDYEVPKNLRDRRYSKTARRWLDEVTAGHRRAWHRQVLRS